MRARQEKVPFATCEDEDTLQKEVKSLVGEAAHTLLGPPNQDILPTFLHALLIYRSSTKCTPCLVILVKRDK